TIDSLAQDRIPDQGPVGAAGGDLPQPELAVLDVPGQQAVLGTEMEPSAQRVRPDLKELPARARVPKAGRGLPAVACQQIAAAVEREVDPTPAPLQLNGRLARGHVPQVNDVVGVYRCQGLAVGVPGDIPERRRVAELGADLSRVHVADLDRPWQVT